MELIDLPGPRVEPGAADDDPKRQTPGNRLRSTSRARYGKTVTPEDVEEAKERVESRQERERQEQEQERERERERDRKPWSLKGGEDEPGG